METINEDLLRRCASKNENTIDVNIQIWKIRRYASKTGISMFTTLEKICNLEKETAILFSRNPKSYIKSGSYEESRGVADGSLPNSYSYTCEEKNPNYYSLRKRLRLLGKWRKILISQSQFVLFQTQKQNYLNQISKQFFQ